MRGPFLAAAIVVGLAVIGAVAWSLADQRPSPVVDAPIFHPDSVTAFSWKMGTASFFFSRETAGGDWAPEADAALINRQLLALVRQKLDRRPLFSLPFSRGISIAIKRGENETARGRFRDGVFRWTEGPWRGAAFRADLPGERLFAEGRFAFDAHAVDWCRARPLSLAVAIDGREFALENRSGQWGVRARDKRRPVDSTTIEKWLGRRCRVEVDFFRDSESFPLPVQRPDRRLVVSFETGSEVSLKRVGGHWLREGERGRAFASRAFDGALEELAALAAAAPAG